VHNAFSNGDGINELFVIDGLEDTICYPENTVEIYNRWGVLVLKLGIIIMKRMHLTGIQMEERQSVIWLPTGTYFYILNYTSVDLNGDIQTNQKTGIYTLQ
jgi:hypothetical protein